MYSVIIILETEGRVNYARVNGLDSNSSTSLIYSKRIPSVPVVGDMPFFQNGDDCFIGIKCKS